MSGSRTIVRLVVTALLALAVGFAMVPRLRLAIHHREMSAALFNASDPSHAKAVEYFSARVDPADELSELRFFLISDLGDRLALADRATLRSLHDTFAGRRTFERRFPVAHLSAVRDKLAGNPSSDFALHALAQASSTGGETDRLAREIIDALTDHPDAGVRRASIEHAAWRFGPGALPDVERALNDPSPDVARAAWLMLPHLGPGGGYRANFAERDLSVAEAVLLASVLMDGEAARELLVRAVARRPELADASACGAALLERGRAEVRVESIDGFDRFTTEQLRALEPTIENLAERALHRLAITVREPTDARVDEALLLAQDGVIPPREALGALLSIGRAREAMRVLLGGESAPRELNGDHGALLRKYFSENSFRVPVPDVIPGETRAGPLAFDALRAWWTCVGNRVVFDASSRVYTLKTPTKTGKATRE